jgi:hypothetical protein
MSSPDSPDAIPFRLSAAVVLPVALMTVLLLGVLWLLRSSRLENATLRAELAELRLAHRAAASRESLAADATLRASRLEETLALMSRPAPAPAPATVLTDSTRAEELERVITFLRSEITAAHETIERLKQDEPPPVTTKARGAR